LTNKKEILLIGGGGHCKSCIEVIESTNLYSIAGIIDTPDKLGDLVLGYPIIGNDNDLKLLKKKYDYALITVGQIKSPEIRINLFNAAKNLGFQFPVIIASTAHVSKNSTIGEGTVIMHQALINSEVTIGKNNIINSKALIEHDCSIGDNNHISTGAILNGTVSILDDTFVGSGTVVNHGITIASKCIISSNSLVRKSLKQYGIYSGSPLKKIK